MMTPVGGRDCHPPLRPVNVAWLLTNRCNYGCGFCWRVLDRRELSLAEAKELTRRLADAGTKKISWAGGEPLLFGGLWDLIDYTKSLGIETMLITNGSLIDDVWAGELPPGLDWLTLPLEGVGDRVNVAAGRDPGHYSLVESLFDRYRDGPVKLKINSVASSKNLDELDAVADLLPRWRIQRWKIFQFYPVRGIAKVHEEEFVLRDADFEAFRARLTARVASVDFDGTLVVESRSDLDRSYYTMAPDGSVYVSDSGVDRYLGNALSEDPVALYNDPLLNKQRYLERSRWMLDV